MSEGHAGWERIGDWSFARFGKRLIPFRRSDTGQSYTVGVDEDDQNWILIHIGACILKFALDHKAQKQGIYELSGGLDDRQNLLDIERTAWVVLTLTTPATIEYCGDRVVVRKDTEAAGDLAVIPKNRFLP